MTALLLCVGVGLLAGQFLTDTLGDFLCLIAVNMAMAWVIMHCLAQGKRMLAAMGAYCLSIMVSSSHMDDLVELVQRGLYGHAIGELPELLIGGLMVPAISMSAVYLGTMLR
ncbi:hypothetical protein D3C76_865940 [compost metagenome]